ncbi:LysM peptidoglycan-binding domain-containing protein [Leisingera sp. ANG-S5]|uniref:LysM peptidoglycan-binding domain-containing protein n=1 Tax=Leisingera sp. ANG-S5 TaxID=1577901 RepID=UPI00057F395C|nr:LysM peptidoglycan-binding domain-containing protein [Leisingera sp. ANG-S5]KIC34684.1 peptidoglycan-binding LysM [Leisingera sp. ANG-S5]
MADASGSGGLGALTLGGIAGTVVVVGGVVLYQLGMFGTVAPDGAVVSEQAAGQAADGGGAFSGEGQESGQPLQNRAIEEAAGNQVEAVEAVDGVQQPEDLIAEDASGAEPEVSDQVAAATGAPDTETSVEAAAVAETGTGEGAEEASDQTTELAALSEPEGIAEQSQPAPETSKEDVFVLQAPELDLVRVDSDGAAVIAGRAQEGVQVSVLLDGVVLEQLEVPAGGEFVALTSIASSSEARVVSLLAEHEGAQSASGASFILAPVAPAETATERAVEQTEEQVASLVPDEPAADEQLTGQADETEAAAEPAAVEQGGQDAESTAATGQGGQNTVETAAAEPVPAETVPAAEPEPPQPQGQAVAVLRADQDGVEVVQPAVPADPDLNKEVALDAISYNGTGGVELSGRARPKSRVRVYVDNQVVAELDAAQDGRWNGRLADVAPGVYTLRLDEIETSSGKVMSRLETPFKRESPEVLPQPERDADPDLPAPLVRAVTIQKGDTLWAISQEKYGSGFLYVRLFEANKDAIRNPDLIYPGQVFTIPE